MVSMQYMYDGLRLLSGRVLAPVTYSAGQLCSRLSDPLGFRAQLLFFKNKKSAKCVEIP